MVCSIDNLIFQKIEVANEAKFNSRMNIGVIQSLFFWQGFLKYDLWITRHCQGQNSFHKNIKTFFGIFTALTFAQMVQKQW